MLFSLPPLAPHSPHTLFHPSVTQTPVFNLSQSNNPNGQPRGPNQQPSPQNQQHSNQQQQQQQQQQQPPLPTPLSILRADEKAIEVRKANICRFGAKWLRPAGVGKTLQGMEDERIEREEAEATANREYLADTQTLPETASAPSTPGALEQDLDDEVPDADDEVETGWVDDDDDLDVQALHSDDGEVGAMVIDDDGIDMMGIDVEGEGDYTQERDLDDGIPEGMDAGSYQHTDTEAEDESSFEAEGQGVLSNSVWESGGRSGISPVGGETGTGAGSVNLPVGATRGGGRRSRGRLGGREN